MKSNTFHLLLALALIASLFQSCSPGRSAVPRVRTTDAIPVKLMRLERSTRPHVITASGRVASEDEIKHGFKIGGIVKTISVREGDRVRRGQVLASLDFTEIDAGLAQARLNGEKAARDLERLRHLYQDSVATLEQFQNAQTALDVAEQHVASAAFNKEHAVIRAPGDGFVLRRFVTPGEVVAPGQPIIATNAGAAESKLLRLGVTARDWTHLKGNERAEATLDAYPGRSFKALVLRKSEANDPETGLYTVDLALTDDGERLATGMVGKATILTSDTTALWNVPYEAVLDADGSGAFVFVTDDGKTVSKRAVVIHSFNDDGVQISSGFREGDMLIVSGSAYLDDHHPVAIIN